ncbi:TIGR03086 family metal-binding protein [Nocardioides maradonensis]
MNYTRIVDLPVSAEEAFELVTQPERLRRWQAVTAYVDLRAGGDFRWTVTPGNHAAGTIHEVEPGRRVVLGFGWEGSDNLLPDASTVTITIEPTAAGSRVVLVHEGLDEAQAAAHAEGWNHFLDRLERVAASGDAGPDEWAWAPEVLDPITAAEASLAVLQPILRGLTNEDKVKQTPCADFDCHALAEHLFGSLVGVGAMAGATVTNPEEGPLENRISVMADQAITAWRHYDGDMSVDGKVPAVVAQAILSIEFLLHAWDFAQATGQQVHVSDELVAYVREIGAPVIDSVRERGEFARAVAGDGMGALDAFAAFSGRTPLAAVPA